MTLLVGKILAALGALTIALTALLVMQVQDLSLGSAPSGLPSTVSTSTAQIVTGSAGIIFATSTNCASRVISNPEGAIIMTLSDRIAQTPTLVFGVFQATDTSVVYDAGLYGCGLWKAIGFITGNITTVETF